MKVKLEDINCPICDLKNDCYVLKGRDLLFGLSGDFTIVQCENCKLMRTNPRPTADTIGHYYPDDYGPYVGTRVSEKTKKKNKVKMFLKPIIRKLFDFKTTSIPDLPKGKMLEIGCASGAYMHQMSEKGWDVSGIEYSAKAAEAARSLGYDVFTGQLENAPPPEELYDLIVGWMVLEHLHDPIVCLNKMNGWAKAQSNLILSVPNAGSFHMKFFKAMWHDLHLPNHLYHFTVPTINKLLLKSGWKVEKIIHHRSLGNLFSSFGNVLESKGFNWLGKKFISLPKYSNYILFPFALILSMFGQTGRMTVWARKVK